jgi:hypothetical protein
MTDEDRVEYRKYAGSGFDPPRAMTPAESSKYHLIARKIYFGLQHNATIADRKERRAQRGAINDVEVKLTYSLVVTHGLGVGDEKVWDDGFRVEIVEVKIPERGEELTPTLKVFYK